MLNGEESLVDEGPLLLGADSFSFVGAGDDFIWDDGSVVLEQSNGSVLEQSRNPMEDTVAVERHVSCRRIEKIMCVKELATLARHALQSRHTTAAPPIRALYNSYGKFTLWSAICGEANGIKMRNDFGPIVREPFSFDNDTGVALYRTKGAALEAFYWFLIVHYSAKTWRQDWAKGLLLGERCITLGMQKDSQTGGLLRIERKRHQYSRAGNDSFTLVVIRSGESQDF